MNKKQRMQNRENAAMLIDRATLCPECGGRGRHFIGEPYTLQHMIDGTQQAGFWTCAKFYGPDGRRLQP